MTLANVEMAQFNRANMHVSGKMLFLLLFLLEKRPCVSHCIMLVQNAVAREMYVSGATLFEGIKDIEGSDWTDTMLRRDQQKLLCEHPTAKGTNPVTGVDTRESLMCLD